MPAANGETKPADADETLMIKHEELEIFKSVFI